VVRRWKKREGDGERAGEGGDCDRGEEGGEEEEVEKVKWRATTALSGTRSFTALPGLLDTAVELELAPSQSTREAWERSKPRKRTLFHSDVSGEKRKKREQVNRRSPSLFFSPGADAFGENKGRGRNAAAHVLQLHFFASSPMRRELSRRLARLAGAAGGDWVAAETGAIAWKSGT
jgi:hypothetical protein